MKMSDSRRRTAEGSVLGVESACAGQWTLEDSGLGSGAGRSWIKPIKDTGTRYSHIRNAQMKEGDLLVRRERTVRWREALAQDTDIKDAARRSYNRRLCGGRAAQRRRGVVVHRSRPKVDLPPSRQTSNERTPGRRGDEGGAKN
ncbi:hypothetical protein B0H14DRAFT_2561615 [Mycena olivaceomarginata]|nr:hypothetical protein B0H14DRAFT_2561615 [Mycena olivaceomarginata]